MGATYLVSGRVIWVIIFSPLLPGLVTCTRIIHAPSLAPNHQLLISNTTPQCARLSRHSYEDKVQQWTQNQGTFYYWQQTPKFIIPHLQFIAYNVFIMKKYFHIYTFLFVQHITGLN